MFKRTLAKSFASCPELILTSLYSHTTLPVLQSVMRQIRYIHVCTRQATSGSAGLDVLRGAETR